MIKNIHKLTGKLRLLRFDQGGVSAIEFAIFAAMLAFGLLNTADISMYIYKRMQLENATEMAVQAAWKLCDPSQGYLPATTSCPGLITAITNAAQSTSLGNQVSISGSPSEGYYCLNTSGSLQLVASIGSNPPSDCTATGVPSMTPADYIRVTTTFSYAPMFPGITVASGFTTPITKTGTMRLN